MRHPNNNEKAILAKLRWMDNEKIIKRCVVCRESEGFLYGEITPPDFPTSRVSEEPFLQTWVSISVRELNAEGIYSIVYVLVHESCSS